MEDPTPSPNGGKLPGALSKKKINLSRLPLIEVFPAEVHAKELVLLDDFDHDAAIEEFKRQSNSGISP
jgi:hypothetical protein